MVKLLRVVMLATVFCLCLSPTDMIAQGASGSSPGEVRYVKRTNPSFDRFTSNPTPEFTTWMRDRFWRAEVFTPYFDDKTGWYPNGWVYRDLYAIYRDSDLSNQHPEWILRDGGGRRLYIPWGCGGGACPQYAGDVGNPAFRRWWIDGAKEALKAGYRGLWIDDVNMEFRVGNGNGDETRPIDPRTGTTMTYENWRRYVAEFVEQIRAELPGVELLHNSIWFAVWGPRDRDPYVKRQIAAADFINLERGFNDDGLRGGDGEWSLKAVHEYIDRLHEAGKGVIVDDFDETPRGREYVLANYFLINGSRDGLGSGETTPENWWHMWDVHLGDARGPRYEWEGLYRRDFKDGIVLVNEPEAPARTVDLPQPMRTSSGATVTRVTLEASSGAVLLGPNASKGRPAPTSTVLATPRPTTLVPPAPKGEAKEPLRGRGRATTTRTARKRSRVVIVSGRVRGAKHGRVRLTLYRKVGRRWRSRRGPIVTLDGKGRFRTTVKNLPPGRYRARATFLGDRSARASRSKLRTFRVRRS